MVTEANHAHFQGLWRRANNLPTLGDLTPDLMVQWASERGLAVDHIEEVSVGTFFKTNCVVMTTGGTKACFPKMAVAGDPAHATRRAAAEGRADLWRKVEWFEPPWVPHGRINDMLDDVRHCSKKQAIQHFDYHTSTLYTVPFQAVCVGQFVPAGRSLVDFAPLIREAFLGFYSGHRASSIAALIPVLEGALTRILAGDPSVEHLTVPDKVDRAVDGAIRRAAAIYFGGMWVPPEYNTVDYLFGEDERVLIFETFRRWLKESFYSNTSAYDGATWLNRHLFAHGMSSSWIQVANFRRLVVALATLGLVESWHDDTNAIPLLMPDMNDDSRLLWQEALFQAEAQSILKRIAEKRYHEHGQLVPELPTDDGALLRRSLLSQDCINDLVRPLRDAGWEVDVDEPEGTGLYMTVHAKSNGEALHVALLYSCATSNEIYRSLQEDFDAILYRGAPYHQHEYAYDVEVHVGPVAGWKPPTAP